MEAGDQPEAAADDGVPEWLAEPTGCWQNLLKQLMKLINDLYDRFI